MALFAIVDCNNFFVSCERVFRPDLVGKPVVVLSNNDGCAVSRSNEVKALGVPMAAPYFKVKPILDAHKATVFSANFNLYGNMSWRVAEVLKQFSPDIEVYSVDESFLGLDHLPIDDYEEWGRNLKQTVEQWTGIPVSVGLGPSKTLAKAAVQMAKHGEGVENFIGLDDDARLALLDELPLGDVWGVGWRTLPKLRAMGMRTAADLARQPEKWAKQTLTIRGQMMVRELNGLSCWGLDQSDEMQQSIARTRSFGHNIRDYHELETAIANFAAVVASKLRRENSLAKELTVFMQSSRFAEEQHRTSNAETVKLPYPTSDTGVIIHHALLALTTMYDKDFAYKRAGVVAHHIVPKVAAQQSWTDPVDPEAQPAREQLLRDIDRINRTDGPGTIRFAAQGVDGARWTSVRKRSSRLNLRSVASLPVVKA